MSHAIYITSFFASWSCVGITCPSANLITPPFTGTSNNLSHFVTSKVYLTLSRLLGFGFRNEHEIGLSFGVSIHLATHTLVSLSLADSSSTQFMWPLSLSLVPLSLNRPYDLWSFDRFSWATALYSTWFTSVNSWPSNFSFKCEAKPAKARSVRSFSLIVRL
jgi:hypothetical protein